MLYMLYVILHIIYYIIISFVLANTNGKHPRRASGQKPCTNLQAHYEFENQRIFREFSGCVLVSPRGPRGPAGKPAETRGWSTIAGPRGGSTNHRAGFPTAPQGKPAR